jgi:hypothetical protein
MKKITLSIAIILFATITTHAQLGGLLKKAKDKVTEKKEVKKSKQEETKETVNTNNEPKNKTSNNDPNVPDTYYLVNNPLGKISFSNQPFSPLAVGGKTTFASNEFIYGRLQLNSGTIKEALKIEEKNKKNPYYNFEYVVVVYRDKENKYNNEQLWNNCLLKDADLDKNYLDFDVLPNPDKATTVISALSDFSAGKSTAPLYAAIQPTIFSEDGIYKVNIIIRNPAKDNWGNFLTKDKWPTFEADFDFEFNSNDVAILKKNKELASTKAEYAIKNTITPLPKQWTEKTSTTAMGFTQAQIITMYENSFDTKLDPHTVVKFHASNSNGGWTTQNNDYGIPIYRYSNQWYTIFIKYANGACYYQGFGLRQQYNGGGTYGKAFVDKNEYHMTDCVGMK